MPTFSPRPPKPLLVTPPGFEPGTNGLKVRCSAVELEGQAPLAARADATANWALDASAVAMLRCQDVRFRRSDESPNANPAESAAIPSRSSIVWPLGPSIPSPVAGRVETFDSGFIIRLRE